MSDVTQLPTGAVRLFKKPTQLGMNALNTLSQQFTAKETWRCPTIYSLNFLKVVYGFPEVVGGTNGLVIRRVTLRHPEYPFCLATSCICTGIGWDATLTALTGLGTTNTHPQGFWKYMDIEVQFQTPVYPLSGVNAFISFQGNPSSRQFPGPASGFVLNGAAPIFDPGEEIIGEDFSVTMHQLPTLPMAVYDSVRDCVNSDPFVMPNGAVRAAGTVLYRGPTYSQTSNFGSDVTWEITHQFSYSNVPWNYYYENGSLYLLTRTSGFPKKTIADLTAIFNV